ncbi:MAG: GGDEF domain-containing protein [Culicoidibacterales bacterium]
MNQNQLFFLIQQLESLCFGDVIDISSQNFLRLEQHIQTLPVHTSSDTQFLHATLAFAHLDVSKCNQLIEKITEHTLSKCCLPLFQTLRFIIKIRTDLPNFEKIQKTLTHLIRWKETVAPEYHAFVLSKVITSFRPYSQFSEISTALLKDLLHLIDSFSHPVVVSCYYLASISALHSKGQLDYAMELSLKAWQLAKYYHFIDYEAAILTTVAHIYEQLNLTSEALKYYQRIIDNPEFDHINATSRSLTLLNIAIIALKLDKPIIAIKYVKQLSTLIEKSNRLTELQLIKEMVLIEIDCLLENDSSHALWHRYSQLVQNYMTLGSKFHISRLETNLLTLEVRLRSMDTSQQEVATTFQLMAHFAYLQYHHSLALNKSFELMSVYQAVTHCYDTLNQPEQALTFFRQYEQVFTNWIQTQRQSTLQRAHQNFEANLQRDTVQKLKRDTHSLQAKSNFDPLTQLYSRYFLNSLLEQPNRPFGYLLLDIDYFKLYNDTFGHLQGDSALKSVGTHIQHLLRSDEYAVRFGGEEFLILFFHCDTKRMEFLATSLQSQLLEQPLTFPNSPHKRLTTSIGLCYFPNQAPEFELAFECVDALLYRAKNSGRNTLIFETSPTL